jgi:hypothetical protein
MPVDFMTNSPMDLQNLGGSYTTNTTTIAAKGFDTNYCKSVLVLSAVYGVPLYRDNFPTARSDFSYQGIWFMEGVGSFGGNDFWVFHAADGTNIFKLYGPTNTAADLYAAYWNGTAWVNIGSALAGLANVSYTFEVRIKIDASVGEFSWYINGSLQSSFTGNTTVSGASAVGYCTFSNRTGNVGAATWYLAELIRTIGERPWGMRVVQHALTGAGTATDWTGAYTDIDEHQPDTADIISSDTTGDVSTFVMSDLPSIGTNVVRAVQVSAYARCGTTGPQNLQLALNVGGTVQVSATKALSTGYSVQRAIFDTNETTSAELTESDVNGAQPGVKAIT